MEGITGVCAISKPKLMNTWERCLIHGLYDLLLVGVGGWPGGERD